MKNFLDVLCDLGTSVHVVNGLSHTPALRVTLAHNVCSSSADKIKKESQKQYKIAYQNVGVLFQSAQVAGNKGKEETVGLKEDASGTRVGISASGAGSQLARVTIMQECSQRMCTDHILSHARTATSLEGENAYGPSSLINIINKRLNKHYKAPTDLLHTSAAIKVLYRWLTTEEHSASANSRKTKRIYVH